jgi:hypothetical protein
MQASGDQTKAIASALAEAFSSTFLTTSIVLLMNSFCFCISS